jgi:PKD repeat protein
MDASNQFSTSSLVTGKVYAADYSDPTPATMTTAIINMQTAYVDAAGRAPDVTELGAGNIGGMTLAPGVYKWSTGVLIPTSTTLTLDAQGNTNAVWIFEIAQDLTMDTSSQVVLINSAKPENIYWQISGGTGVTIEAGAHAEGNILTLKAITMKEGASLHGRALAQTAVTLIGNTVTSPTDSPVVPVADFTGNPTTGTAPLAVTFTDRSTNTPTSWSWNFGDSSSVNATVQNPVHTYASAGTYTVALTATNSAGSNLFTRTNYITVTSGVVTPVANFTGTPTSGTAPLTVTFIDSSTNTPSSWNWVFGDGSTSTSQNPSKIYSANGTYTVSLTATNAGGSNTSTKNNYINVTGTPVSHPVANFTYYPSIGPAPLIVTFTDTSSNNESIASRLWQFGDGNSSTVQNPVHSYTNAGSFNVTLNITDQNGAFSLCTHNNAITVTSAPPGSVDLGLAGNYAILSKSGISTIGSTLITGNMGVSPILATAITGFDLSMDPSNQFSTSSLVVGSVYAADYAPPTPATLTTSVSNMETAYVDASTRAPDATDLYAGNLGGKTLAPGVYRWSTGVLIPTSPPLTLDAQGNSNAVWIFEVAQDLTMDTGSQVVLINSAKPENIYWQIGGDTGVTIEAGSHAEGNILALKAITMKDGASLNGRALSQTAVSLIANTVTIPTSTATTSTVGVFRNGTVYLAGSNTNGGLPVNAFNYGMTGDKPITGKWTGTGIDSIGIFRNGMFYLRNSNTGGFADTTFNYGQAGDVPITGDWTGSGVTRVGIFRSGTFFLASSNTPGGGSVNAFNFGRDRDVPVTGDWNADGKTEVGIFREGMFYLASSNSPGGGTVTAFNFGQAGDVPVTGDWNADGKTEVGIFRNGMVYQATSTGTLNNYFYYGMANDLPVGGYFG